MPRAKTNIEAVTAYLLHVVRGLSMREIARRRGRNSSSVMRQVHKVEWLRDDPDFDGYLARLEAWPCALAGCPAAISWAATRAHGVRRDKIGWWQELCPRPPTPNAEWRRRADPAVAGLLSEFSAAAGEVDAPQKPK